MVSGLKAMKRDSISTNEGHKKEGGGQATKPRGALSFAQWGARDRPGQVNFVRDEISSGGVRKNRNDNHPHEGQ